MSRSLIGKALLVGSMLLASSCVSGGSSWGGGECLDLHCGWETKQGALEETHTWHKDDRATALVGAEALATRLAPSSRPGACMVFDFLADIDASVQVELQLDFNDDGTIDWRASVPAVHWKQAQLIVSTPLDYAQLRMTLHKVGAGRAVFARFGMGSLLSCPSAPRIKLQDGTACSVDDTCMSGRCAQNRCAACGPGGCIEGESCRQDAECLDGSCAGGVCRACAKQGTCATNETCSSDAQCASGSCVESSVPSMRRGPSSDGLCGECDTDADCARARASLADAASARPMQTAQRVSRAATATRSMR